MGGEGLLPPQPRPRRRHKSVRIHQASLNILCKPERPVKVGRIGQLRQQHRRRHREGTGHHAPDHHAHARPPCLAHHRQRLGQPARLVEFHIH
ncbi:hypothetical protein RZS08_62675, partial [Arthrospira platensis SPKY1]|nr:hypothetical protein [Arthrospira platensis SPKY1]